LCGPEILTVPYVSLKISGLKDDANMVDIPKIDSSLFLYENGLFTI
jgi:hypothetical protein